MRLLSRRVDDTSDIKFHEAMAVSDDTIYLLQNNPFRGVINDLIRQTHPELTPGRIATLSDAYEALQEQSIYKGPPKD